MIWYRDGIVWVPAPDALAEQREALKAGALVVVVDGTDALPALGDAIEFNVLVDGQRLGPLAGRVVRVDGQEVALHLDGAAQQTLLTCVGDRPAPPAPTSRAAATPGAPATPRAPAGAATGQLAGRLQGRLMLGMVPCLFEEVPAAPPTQVATPVRLFGHLHRAAASGLLTVEGRGYVKQVSFKRGVVVNVTVTPIKEDEQLGQLLLSAHWITPHKLADVLRWARSDRIPIGSALLQSGVLDDARLNRALTHQTFRRLRDIFEWEGAVYSFDPSGVPTTGAAPISVPRLLNELCLDLFRTAPLSDLTELLSAYAERFPRLEGDPSFVKRLVADEKMLRACERVFRGDRTLRQAMTALVADRPKTVRLVLYLIAARGLALHVEPPDVPASRLPQVIRERVRAIGVQDAFQRLGVVYWAHPSEIEAARRARLACYGEGSAYRRVDAASTEKICQLIDEAVLLVATAQARRRYRARVLGGERLALHARLVSEHLAYLRAAQREEEALRAAEVLAELTEG